jgi:putative cardiolipin synthase
MTYRNWLAAALTASVLALAGGCASVDFDYPKPQSVALQDTGGTYLGRQLEGVAAAHPEGQSGFFPLSDGIDALAVRLLMAEEAERSIDAQYYLLKDDIVGNAFIDALLRAADRHIYRRLRRRNGRPRLAPEFRDPHIQSVCQPLGAAPGRHHQLQPRQSAHA